MALISNKANELVYLDVSIGKKPAQRIIIELFSSIAPRSCKNFRLLCTGENPNGFSYRNTIFHRIIPSFMCQGGDFENHDGTGGQSIYGRTFDDENFTLTHDVPGLLSLANAGPNTNGSQFFITLVPCPWLDGKHTVFGKVLDGPSMEVVRRMEACGSQDGTVGVSGCVKVVGCGELSPAEGQDGGVGGVALRGEGVDLEGEAKRRLAARNIMTAQDDLRRIAEHERAERMKAALEAEARAEVAAGSGDDSRSDGDDVDAAGDDSDEKKKQSTAKDRLKSLKSKMRRARKENQTAVIDEIKQERASKMLKDAMGDVGGGDGRKKWFKDKEKMRQKELTRLGLGPEQAYLVDTAEQAEFKEQKNARAAREKKIEAKLKELATLYEGKGATAAYVHGGVGGAPPEAVERMVADLEGGRGRRKRRSDASEVIDYVNPQNAKINRSLEKAYGKYTKEIKANLERGTALPDN